MITIIILLIFIMIFSYWIYKKSLTKNQVYVKSDIDNSLYLVRDVPDKYHAANMLAKIKQNIRKIIDYTHKNIDKYKDYKDYITQMKNKLIEINIIESSEDSIYTSYSVNKGEQIVFCLRTKRTKNEIHDLNLMMYVVLHELAHVACPEFGHTPLFKKIFAFLCQVAIDLGLYYKIDFNNNPTEYCGLTITDSII